MATNPEQTEAFLAEPLTRRELEVVSLLANGLSNREVADALTVAPSTVKWYTKQIYSKLSVTDRKSAVEQARALGLLEPVASPHSLPPETTRFIGRGLELRKIKRDMKNPDCRLLTLIGPGGVGKTRLAARAASDIALEDPTLFKDGIHFVPLAAQHEASALAVTIAGVLDFPLSGSAEPAEQLLNYLRNKQMLLALDNFEQLLEGSDLVAELLVRAPRIKLLVTSREALNLAEEWRLEVAGLPLPPPAGGDVLANDAVQLFVERASRVRTDFSQAENASCIAQICRLVDGVPLAIELAASWIRSLSCAAIADEIEASLDFLETSLRNVPERHQSMRVVFDQSWSQLSPAEKDIYRALSVFSGGFTLAAAKSVAEATPAVLTALVDKSLVRREYSDRYQMHELLRNYAAEKLAGDADRQREVRARHSRFYSDLAHSHQASWGNRDQLLALEVFKAGIYNFLKAWEWSLSQADIHRLDQMLFSLNEFYYWRGRLKDGIALCQGLYERLVELDVDSQADQDRCVLLRCKALLWESTFITQLQNSVHAKARLAAAQELLDSVRVRERDFLFVQAHIWLQTGRTEMALGEQERAKVNLERSLATFTELQEDWGAAAAWAWLGMSGWIIGDLAESAAAFKEALSLWDKLGDRRNVASSKDFLAVTFRNMGHWDGVVDLHLDAIATARQLNDPLRVGWMLHNLTWTHWFMGDFHTGSDTGSECVSIAEDLGNALLLTAARGCKAACLLHLGEYARALALAESAYSPSLRGLLWQPFVPLTLGEAALALGDTERAFNMITESSQTMLESRPAVAAIPLASLALAALTLGQQQEAESHLKQALSLSLKSKIALQARRAFVAGAALAATRGRSLTADRLIKAALASPHCANSKWYVEMAARFLERVPHQTYDTAPGADSSALEQETIWQLVESHLESLS